MDVDRGVYFDEDFRVRILEVDKFDASKSLLDNTDVFVNNIQSLQSMVEKYVAAIDQQVEKLESEKLKAVGLRNKVAALSEERKRKQKEQERIIAEKQEELERLQKEEQSLLKVKSDQESLLAKLQDSSSGAAYS